MHMPRRKTRRYDGPKIDLNKINFPKVELPKAASPGWNIKVPQINLPWKQFLVAVGLVVLALVMLNLNSRLSDFSRLSRERDQIATEVGGLAETRTVLQTQLAFVGSDPAVIEGARDAHMVREGEKLVIVLTPDGNVAPTPVVPEEELKPPQPWEIWVALFLGR